MASDFELSPDEARRLHLCRRPPEDDGGVLTDKEILLEIQAEMDGTEWGSETLDRIASLLNENGYPLRDSIVKQMYGLKGTRESVLAQLEQMVEDAIAKKGAQRLLDTPTEGAIQ